MVEILDLEGEYLKVPTPAEPPESKVFSRLVHDLRSPLNLIVGYADLLSMESAGPLNPKQKQFVEMIRSGADALEREIRSYQERLRSNAPSDAGAGNL